MHPILKVRIHTGVNGGLCRRIQGMISLGIDGTGGRPEGWGYWCIVMEDDVRDVV